MASPLDGLQSLAERAEAELLAAVAAMPGLPGELWRVWPRSIAPLLPILVHASAVCAAVILGYLLVRRLTLRRRERAARMRSAFAGMVTLAGLELLALAAAVVTGRVLLVRWLGIAPGTGGFTTDLTIALIRWLFGVTLTLLLLQPSVRRFRLAALDDAGARKAIWRVAILFAVGHAHVVLLNAAQRAGLGLPSVKLLSCLVALGMTAGALQLLGTLRRHGMRPIPRFSAAGLTLATLALWVWGWVALDFDLYRGAVGTIIVLLLAVALDRAVAISIRDSRRPAMMRLLFVLRVVIDALAAAFVLRIAAEFWVMEAFGVFSAEEWPGFARRLTFASIVLVLAVTLVAVIHAWTEAKLTPPETGMTAQEREYRLARLSTVLPIIRFVAIGVIGVAFSLVALSAIGVDTTPLMAGAGIVGLAISFGSQTLVKDIVSGIFYMLDDVFRLGETIEAGSRCGQLEQINLRSVRLRDQAGRLHTIPLGDLGAVTNHSRRLVRMTVSVSLDAVPGQAELLRFSRNAAAALRSEPMIHAAIAGDISVRLTEPSDAAEGMITFSFSLAATTAERARDLAQRLVDETVEEARMAAVSGAVSVTVADLPTAPATPPSPPPAPAVTAPQPQAMP
ncbi:mechanosensitive ion channel domain-containing protein [Bosea sp. CS1GBMeth4]|uniref:mechanosensitive ion channel family protein n=1 Tax=Bosea sp. CS1GBMeth4 TaxID=1892849 RepID=UPI0016479227|nr:mechanosensitive ion channel domain-containing protein [Bosea sp. CS1GBMeth4]